MFQEHGGSVGVVKPTYGAGFAFPRFIPLPRGFGMCRRNRKCEKFAARREPIVGRASLIVLLIELAPIHKFFQTQFFQSVFERSSGSLVSTGQFVVVPNHIW